MKISGLRILLSVECLEEGNECLHVKDAQLAFNFRVGFKLVESFPRCVVVLLYVLVELGEVKSLL